MVWMLDYISQFQNRRAKQKKIDSRAQKTAEGKTSPSRPPVIPFIEPALLNAPQQLSTSSFGSSTSLSEGSGPSVPPFGPSSGYSTAYTPSSISSHYSDVPEVQQTLQYEPHFVGNGNNMPYFPVVAPLVPQDSYPPYQYNSYFPDVKPAYGQTSFAHQSQQQGENAFWESTVHTTAPNVSLGGQDAWGLRQARPLASALDGLNTSVSVSPVSSKNSSLDETALAPRTRNAMPPALSNLGGLSIVPYTDDIVSQEPVYDLSGLPATYSDSPAAAALVMAGPPVQRVPNNTPFLAPYPSNVGYGITPYDGTVVPDRSIPSPMAPALPPTSAGPPALLPAAAVNTVEGPVPYSYPWAPQIPIADGTVRPSSLQVVQHPGLLQNNFMSSAPTNMSQINTALSARRQSLHAYPGDKDFSTVASLQNQRQQGPPASLPKGFSMLDDSGIPIRRASTSAINSIAPIPKIQPVSEPGPLDPQRQAVLDSAAQAVLPLVASPPLVSDTQIFSKPTSPARHRSEGGIPSTPSASTTTHAKFEDTPILGGLRKGSISKKLKSPSNTYSPYPQEHPRHTNGQVKHR